MKHLLGGLPVSSLSLVLVVVADCSFGDLAALLRVMDLVRSVIFAGTFLDALLLIQKQMRPRLQVA